jgi:predicted enzyme related to lactoylglutathione lyase
MGNPFVHLELATPDLGKAKAFYEGLFGWQFADQDMGQMGVYSTFKPASGPGGGAYSMPGMAPGWLAYVGVEDIDESTEKARTLGATIVRDVTEIPHVGWMSILVDPTGATIALFEPAPGTMPPA